MIISLEAEKEFNKIQHPCMLSLVESRNSRPIPNIIKAMYSKTTANIKLIGEILGAISLKLGSKQGCPLPPFLFNIVLEVLARTMYTDFFKIYFIPPPFFFTSTFSDI